MIKKGTLLKLGAAILVGTAVFIGSTLGTRRKSTGSQDNNNTASQEGLKDVQSVMMKTSQFITTMITVSDAIGRLMSVDTGPRYTSSTIIL